MSQTPDNLTQGDPAQPAETPASLVPVAGSVPGDPPKAPSPVLVSAPAAPPGDQPKDHPFGRAWKETPESPALRNCIGHGAANRFQKISSPAVRHSKLAFD